MNAEQKAFYEYGKAFERMNSTKKRLRGIWHSDKCIRTRIGQAAIIGPRHKRNVKDAWQKRAAETGQPGTFVRAPSREDTVPRFHEIYNSQLTLF